VEPRALPMTDRPTEFKQAFEELTARTRSLSSALRTALAHVLPETSGARACGRALRLRRSLGWQVYAVAHSTDASTVLRALPREQGWDLIQHSLQRAGCPVKALDALRSEIQATETLLSGAKIDRAMLRAVAGGSLDSARERQATRRARRTATAANERIFGIRARANVVSVLLGPTSQDGRFDSASTTILHGIRRLRAGSPWPVYQSAEFTHSREESMRTASGRTGKGKGGPFMEALSTPGIAKHSLQRRRCGNAVIYELIDDTDSRGNEVQICFAEHIAGAGTAEQSGQRSELHLSTNMPMHVAVFEVFIHRSHHIVSQPSASLVGSPRVFGSFPEPPENLRLPLEVDAELIAKPNLPTGLRACDATRSSLLAQAASMLTVPLEDFAGYRVIVRDPPIHSRIVLAWQM
jgi:hypothetical protein